MGIVTPEKEQKLRYAICNICPEFNVISKRCKSCGCYMPLKTKLAAANCKKNFWKDPAMIEKASEKGDK